MLKDRVINNLETRRNNILNGKINCIPFPFKRFRNSYPGLEQGKYICVTGSTKSAKSQFASNVFIFNSILYAYKHQDLIRLKVFYYPLEETPENVLERFISYLLYIDSKRGIRISPIDLRSTNENNILDLMILNKLNEPRYQSILTFFEQCIEFSSQTNPTNIMNELKTYAENNGKSHYKNMTIKDENGLDKDTSVFEYYEPNNKEEYKIVFLDHLSLVSLEKGLDLRESMAKMSEYFVMLRNRYKFTPIVIQQQALFENIDAYKLNLLKPSVANMADCKSTSRDFNMLFSIFAPFKYGIPNHLGYDIKVFKDNIRFVEVLLNRDGVCNDILPLYFDGSVCSFEELPQPGKLEEIASYYSIMKSFRQID